MRTPAWIDSATKNAHMRKITRSKLLLSVFFFFILSLPFSFSFPLSIFSFHLVLRSCHPWVKIMEEYTPLIALWHTLSDWSQSFSVLLLSPHFSFAPSFPFVLFFSFLFLHFPLPFPFPFPLLSFPLPFPFLLFLSSLIFVPGPKTLWFLPPPFGGGGIMEEYTPVPTPFANDWQTLHFPCKCWKKKPAYKIW